MSKLEKINCEVCGEKNKEVLHAHHIEERTSVDCSNNNWNMIVICPTEHSKIHNGDIKIIGVWPSTSGNGRKVVYIKDGVCNFPALEFEQPPFKNNNKSMKIYDKETNEKP